MSGWDNTAISKDGEFWGGIVVLVLSFIFVIPLFLMFIGWIAEFFED